MRANIVRLPRASRAVPACGALVARPDAILPVVARGQAAARPADHRRVEGARRLNHIFAPAPLAIRGHQRHGADPERACAFEGDPERRAGHVAARLREGELLRVPSGVGQPDLALRQHFLAREEGD